MEHLHPFIENFHFRVRSRQKEVAYVAIYAMMFSYHDLRFLFGKVLRIRKIMARIFSRANESDDVCGI